MRQGGIQKWQREQKRQKGLEFLPFLLSLPFLYSTLPYDLKPNSENVSRHQMAMSNITGAVSDIR